MRIHSTVEANLKKKRSVGFLISRVSRNRVRPTTLPDNGPRALKLGCLIAIWYQEFSRFIDTSEGGTK
jgi:hypothetical protein